MKILNVQQIRELDEYTIKNEPIKSYKLMERAANVFTKWFLEYYYCNKKIIVFSGIGNNGGDGLVVAQNLSKTFENISVYIVEYSESYSKDFKYYFDKIKKNEKIKINFIRSKNDFPEIQSESIIIDAIFGTGLTRETSGFVADIISKINKSNQDVVAIDIPSGLFCDKSSNIKKNSVIKANRTLTFQLPKLSMMFPENYEFYGESEFRSIDLCLNKICEFETNNYYLTKDDIQELIIKRSKFSHKGNYGHSYIISGSYGKIGASVLTAKACLKSGCGLVTVHIPKCGYNIIQTSIPEAMVNSDKNDNCFTDKIEINNNYTYSIGPGLGTDSKTKAALLKFIKSVKSPLVIDADAINILSEDVDLLKLLPKNSILTPHIKEFERLFGKQENDFDRNLKQREMSKKYGIIIVLKGANTCISDTDNNCYFNSTGNPGMATAGSGDVLTGIITGLLAQGYSPINSAKLGVFIHGLSADIDIKNNNNSYESLIASDIINNIGKAFLKIK